jgi:hypothetical protein
MPYLRKSLPKYGYQKGEERVRAITSVIAAVTLGLFTLAPQAFAQDKGPVGISMPT